MEILTSIVMVAFLVTLLIVFVGTAFMFVKLIWDATMKSPDVPQPKGSDDV